MNRTSNDDTYRLPEVPMGNDLVMRCKLRMGAEPAFHFRVWKRTEQGTFRVMGEPLIMPMRHIDAFWASATVARNAARTLTKTA